MKLQLHYRYLAFLLVFFTLTSCVSKKKYVELKKGSAARDTAFAAERAKFRSTRDSLRYVIAAKDSLIDSLSFKLNELMSKREKEKAKTAVLASAKKSTLSREQECEKKSLFLYNFTKHVEWPIEYNGTEFVIGVAGDDQTVKQLQEFMQQKKVSGKKIIVEKYKKGARYNVVYVTSSNSYNFAGIKSMVKKNKTLLVTDDNLSGSHITFLIDQDKVRYIVDKISIEKTGMKVGQELMRYSG